MLNLLWLWAQSKVTPIFPLLWHSLLRASARKFVPGATTWKGCSADTNEAWILGASFLLKRDLWSWWNMFICKLSICIFICINICQPYTAIFFKIGLSICTPVHHGLPIRNDQLWIILDDSKKSPLALCRKLRLFEFLTCLTFGDSRCFFFGDEDCECAIDPLH